MPNLSSASCFAINHSLLKKRRVSSVVWQDKIGTNLLQASILSYISSGKGSPGFSFFLSNHTFAPNPRNIVAISLAIS